VSDFGSYITTITSQVLVVLTLDGSAAEVGFLNASLWLPYLLFGLVVGALARGSFTPVHEESGFAHSQEDLRVPPARGVVRL